MWCWSEPNILETAIVRSSVTVANLHTTSSGLIGQYTSLSISRGHSLILRISWSNIRGISAATLPRIIPVGGPSISTIIYCTLYSLINAITNPNPNPSNTSTPPHHLRQLASRPSVRYQLLRLLQRLQRFQLRQLELVFLPLRHLLHLLQVGLEVAGEAEDEELDRYFRDMSL